MRPSLSLALVLISGCATPGVVSLRPDGSPGPEPCPQAALDAMDHIRLHPGDTGMAVVDINKIKAGLNTINDGPIESVLKEPLGPILPDMTRLYGKVWTSG